MTCLILRMDLSILVFSNDHSRWLRMLTSLPAARESDLGACPPWADRYRVARGRGWPMARGNDMPPAAARPDFHGTNGLPEWPGRLLLSRSVSVTIPGEGQGPGRYLCSGWGFSNSSCRSCSCRCTGDVCFMFSLYSLTFSSVS